MRSPSATSSKLTLEIEVAGTYSRSSRYTTYEEALQSDGNQSISRLEVTLKEHREGEQQDHSKPEIYHHSVIFDPAERIKPHEFLLFPPGTGSYISADWSSSLATIIEKPPPPPYFLNVTKEGIEIGGTLISWGDIENNAQWPERGSFGVFVGGEYVGNRDDNLLVAIEGSHNEQVRYLAPSLLAELDYLLDHGRLDNGLTSEAQIMREAHTRPEVLLELSLSMPWDYARRIIGHPRLGWWIEANHPESPKKRMPIPQTPPTPKTVNSSDSPTPSSPHLEHPPSNEEIMFGLASPFPPEATKMDEREITRIAPDNWPQELQKALLPMWKDGKGNPLPTNRPLFSLKGELNYPNRMKA